MMTFTHEVKDNILLLNLQGDLLGLSEEQELVEFVKKYINDGIKNCAVDISGVGYMNSTGLSLLIRLLTRFRNESGDMVLVRPSSQVQKLLVITKLNAIFTVVNEDSELSGAFDD